MVYPVIERQVEIPERDKIELRKWDALIETSPHEFHTFWWLKQVEMDYETYLTYTNSVYPISLLNVKKGWKVLDIGCGWGRDLNILGKAYGANAIGIEVQRLNNDIFADSRFLCFKDNSFDAVIAITTLAFVKEEELMLREIRRVLKHDGKLLLLIYNNSISNFAHKILKMSAFGVWSASHYGGYRKLHTMKGILSLLESLDYKVEEAYHTNFAVTLLNRLPKFCKIVFKYENKLSKMWFARWMAKRIVVIAKANK